MKKRSGIGGDEKGDKIWLEIRVHMSVDVSNAAFAEVQASDNLPGPLTPSLSWRGREPRRIGGKRSP